MDVQIIYIFYIFFSFRCRSGFNTYASSALDNVAVTLRHSDLDTFCHVAAQDIIAIGGV